MKFIIFAATLIIFSVATYKTISGGAAADRRRPSTARNLWPYLLALVVLSMGLYVQVAYTTDPLPLWIQWLVAICTAILLIEQFQRLQDDLLLPLLRLALTLFGAYWLFSLPVMLMAVGSALCLQLVIYLLGRACHEFGDDDGFDWLDLFSFFISIFSAVTGDDDD